ncbi:MAG: cytochrome c [Hyphomicrobiales bacterium]|nr:cytochrome c [Hyphomicrobiales bacterium]
MRVKFTLTIGAIILMAMMSTGRADPAAGQAVFKARECVVCHYTEGPAREKTIEDQLTKKGPELWYAGDKFQADWLAGWLLDPKPIRPMKFNSLTEENAGDHPSLNAEEAATVGEYLMSLTSGEVKAGTVKVKRNSKGRQIFTKKMPCSGCHQYTGRKKVIAGGRSGPSLVDAGVRLNPDWILAYLKKPKVFKPIKMMPVFVGLLSDKDMANVASYVGNFKPKKK